MVKFTVALKKADGQYEYADIEADTLEMVPDPEIYKGSLPRYYVLKNHAEHGLEDEVARFNERDVAGIFQGEVRIVIHGGAPGDVHIGP